MKIPSDHLDLARKLWEYHKVAEPFEKADLIIGLGSYDLKTARHCAELLKKQVAPLLIFTGKHGNWTEGRWGKSEAETFRDYAVKYGANSNQILIEPNSTNIGENMGFAKKLLKDHPINKTIIVTKPNTLRRALATAEIQWPDVMHSTDCVQIEMLDQVAESHDIGDLINEMVGDIQRIIEYPKLGYQTEQSIPKAVREAYSTLISLGYNKHLMQ